MHILWHVVRYQLWTIIGQRSIPRPLIIPIIKILQVLRLVILTAWFQQIIHIYPIFFIFKFFLWIDLRLCFFCVDRFPIYVVEPRMLTYFVKTVLAAQTFLRISNEELLDQALALLGELIGHFERCTENVLVQLVLIWRFGMLTKNS